MKRVFIILYFIFVSTSLSAQLFSEYDLCISNDSSYHNHAMRDGVYISLKLFVDNKYAIELLDQRSSDILDIFYISIGTYHLYYDTLKLKEQNDEYEMKFIIGEDSNLMPFSSFSGFEGKYFKGTACAFFEPDYTNYLCKRCLSKGIPIRCLFSRIPERGLYCDGDLELSFKAGYYCLKYSGYVLSEGVCLKKRNRLFLYDPFLDAKLEVLTWKKQLYLKFCYYQFVMENCKN